MEKIVNIKNKKLEFKMNSKQLFRLIAIDETKKPICLELPFVI